MPLKQPSAPLARSSTHKKFAGYRPPDLCCFSTNGYPAPPGLSQMVTMTGIVEIFSYGCQSTDLRIEVWTVRRSQGADDGDLNTIVGTPINTEADCTATGVGSEEEDCGTLVDSKVVTVGFFRVRVFEDAVTSMTFRGLPPFLVPHRSDAAPLDIRPHDDLAKRPATLHPRTSGSFYDLRLGRIYAPRRRSSVIAHAARTLRWL